MLNYDLKARAIQRFNNGEHLKIKILSRGNMKLNKGEKRGFMTTGVSLSPANMVASKTLCSHASEGCKMACLNTSGQGALYMIQKDGFNMVQDSRALKTIWWERDRESFLIQLKKELALFEKRAKRADMIPACRLNVLSDIMWQTETDIMQSFPSIQFYGYTKVPAFKNIPDNYHVTFSRSENNQRHVNKAIREGVNVAIVFDELPKTYMGIPVINGDLDDLRFLDPKGVIVGLKAKAQAKKDDSGFVVSIAA